MRKASIFSRFLIVSLILQAFSISMAHAQMEFVENKGQWNSAVDYRGLFPTGSFYLEKQGFTVLMHQVGDLEKIAAQMHGHEDDNNTAAKTAKPLPVPEPIQLRSFAYRVKFLGSSANAFRQPEKSLNTYNNYITGNDPSNWASNCSLYQAVLYKNVYPNIDVRYYSSGAKIKYDFIVRPGGNPNAIAIRYDGPTLELRNKELVIKTSVGEATELEPYSYQAGAGKPTPVDCKYKLEDNVVTFQLKNYDPTKTLVIDPSIIFVSFTGSTSDNWGYTATPGADGSFYAGGIAFNTGYPVSTGAYDVTFNGGVSQTALDMGYDVAIFKFSANGSNRRYATYIGGTRNEQPHSLIEDAQGNLIVAGATNSGGGGSAGFPTLGGASVASSGTDYDIFVLKLNSTGTALIGSAKIGGSGDDGINIKPKYEQQGLLSLRTNYGDDARSEVIIDGGGNIILSSCTQSTNFPVRNSGVQTSSGGAQDGIILKIASNFGNILFSTYFGGPGDDAAFVCSINPTNGNLYVGGSTASSSLPGTGSSTISSTNRGGIDGFVTILNPAGTAVIKTTFIGTAERDLLFGLKFDRFGFPYIMGTTLSANWPRINATFGNTGSKQFIAKIEPDLSAYIYSTTFGNGSAEPNISPIAFLVDKCENVYVSGWGGGLNNSFNYSTGNTTGLPEVNPLSGIQAADGKDLYFFVLEKNANSILFASHFGQNGGLGDHVDGGTSRFDEAGIIYQAVCANCGRQGTFPTTAGVFAPLNGSSSCNQAAVKIEMNFGGVAAKLQTAIDGNIADTTACLGDAVTFQDILLQGKKFIFDFGDGSPRVTTFAPQNSATYTYPRVGTYTVMLIAEDSAKCNIRDTSYKTIAVANNKVGVNFTVNKLQPCTSLNYEFTNNSTTNGAVFPPGSFEWDYGDGSPRDRTNGFAPNPTTHTYAATGTYTVRLFLINPDYCNSPDSAVQTLRVNPIVKAIFTSPALGCAPYVAFFKNESQAGTSFDWELENGTTFSTSTDATFTFTLPGTYRVRLIANDPSTCNLTDTSAFFTITVLPKPTALADWSPNPPIENVPVKFTNMSSSGSIRFKWFFGDGDSSTLANPTHEYNATGTYTATLIAYNQLSCSDTFDLQVRVIIFPALDVPNAFTPGKFGENGIVRVRGFGIVKMNWNIYNRWGQLVFSSTSKNQGWDGTFKGKLQAMDVYAYTLEVEMSDGEKIRKTGDITLIR